MVRLPPWCPRSASARCTRRNERRSSTSPRCPRRPPDTRKDRVSAPPGRSDSVRPCFPVGTTATDRTSASFPGSSAQAGSRLSPRVPGERARPGQSARTQSPLSGRERPTELPYPTSPRPRRAPGPGRRREWPAGRGGVAVDGGRAAVPGPRPHPRARLRLSPAKGRSGFPYARACPLSADCRVPAANGPGRPGRAPCTPVATALPTDGGGAQPASAEPFSPCVRSVRPDRRCTPQVPCHRPGPRHGPCAGPAASRSCTTGTAGRSGPARRGLH